MAKICILLVAALAVSALADPLRFKRSNNQINTAATGALTGDGSVEDSHAAAVSALGIPSSPGNGWGEHSGSGIPASISVANVGTSELGQSISILEITNNNPDELSAIQTVNVANVLGAGDSLEVIAEGVEASVASSSDAAAAGSGSIVADGVVSLTNQ